MTALRSFLHRHPRLATWFALAAGMTLLLLLAAGGKGLAPGQLAWLLVAGVGLAGACAWIIAWE